MKLRILSTLVLSIAVSACGGAANENTNGNTTTNSNPAAGMTPAPNIDSAATPPVAQKLTESAPGIDPNTRPREIKPGSSPIPGIPNAKDAVIKTDPNKSPAPGIPSENEIRKMLNTPQDANVVNRPSGPNATSRSGNEPANKSRRSLGGKVDK